MNLRDIFGSSPEHAEAVVDALDHLLEHGPERKSVGICSNLRDHMDEAGVCLEDGTSLLVSRLSTGWPKHSGDDEFPVPHRRLPASSAYYELRNLWAGKYGQDRRDLVGWMRDRLVSLIEAEAV